MLPKRAGRAVAGPPGRVVPELANVYVDMTAWDNLMFVGEFCGVAKKERTARVCSGCGSPAG
ncbi:MAG: hypothetical protein QME70_01480 [Bacillota bacterium]|nr:hypothetical protein [Bacillota bacterium]